MLEKVINWIYLRYGIEVPKLDIILTTIILVGLIVLGASIIFNGVHFGRASSGGPNAVSMPVPMPANNSSAPGMGGKI